MLRDDSAMGLEVECSSSGSASASKQAFVIGVAGGTASGKTTLCNRIIEQLRDHRVVLINQDSFYRGLSPHELIKASDYNFDDPDAIDTDQMLDCLMRLVKYEPVEIPTYDFVLHRRSGTRQVNAADVVILEGILVFHEPRVRELMNMKIFVDEDADVRLARRIKRDTIQRGRDLQGVLLQYEKFVKRAFDDLVMPSKKFADVIVPRGADNSVATDLLFRHIMTKLGQHDLSKIYPTVDVIRSTYQIRGILTLIRDTETTKDDFVFYADRLIRLVVEHGLGQLPFEDKQVKTPTGSLYTGVVFARRLCGVSIIRSGESMENALRACCKGIKIGKLLIQREEGEEKQHLIYEKLPQDIAKRHVLLLDPILATGTTAVQAIELLVQRGVHENQIIFLNLIAAPEGIRTICDRFPAVKIVTSEIDEGLDDKRHVVPGMGEFADRYFGTDEDVPSTSLSLITMASDE